MHKGNENYQRIFKIYFKTRYQELVIIKLCCIENLCATTSVTLKIILQYIFQSVLEYFLVDTQSLVHCDVTRCVFAYPVKLSISTRNTVTKNLPKKLYCNFRYLYNAIKKILDKMSCHSHFKIILSLRKLRA